MDENASAINDVVGVLVLCILVLLQTPTDEFFALMDVVWMFHEEDTVVCAVWRGGRVKSKGDL